MCILILAGPGQTVYSASTAVSCASPIPQVTCTFVNRCKQSRSTSTDINIIKGMFISISSNIVQKELHLLESQNSQNEFQVH